MSLIVSGATIIDGVADRPIEGKAIWVEEGRIKAIDTLEEIGSPPRATVLDAMGKYVIPGMLDANVHLLLDVCLENLMRYWDRFEDLITEAAQVALKSGLTTVFDTWGPRKPLMAVRDRINAGKVPGSRIFCAGNIVGLDGPCSPDFFGNTAQVATPATVERINALWAENVGSSLGWLTPGQVAQEVAAYIEKGVDFIKYASSEHRLDPNTFLALSPRSQRALVEQTHHAGLTAQAHTNSVEGLWAAIEAGCDLIQHCNITGPVPIPEETLELLVKRRTAAVVFAFTAQRWKMIEESGNKPLLNLFGVQETNVRRLMDSGAMLLSAGDAALVAPETSEDPKFKHSWIAAGEDNLSLLGEGHFAWLKAMQEKGLPAMEGLKAVTRNIAVAYQKDRDLGTLEPGKVADMVILKKDPLQAAANYRSIHRVIKQGVVVDRDALPVTALLTGPLAEPSAEVLAYRRRTPGGSGRFPCC